MTWQFGPDDEDAYARARDDLLARFAVAGHDDMSDASLMLDWKFGYGDGDLLTWTPGELSDFVLEWIPSKVSVPATAARGMVKGFQRFVAFLATERLLGGGSAPWRTLDEHLGRLGGRLERALDDPSKFGTAKSIFAGMGTDLTGDFDENQLQAMMDTFNALPPDDRARILSLVNTPGPLDPWGVILEGIEMLPEVPLPDAELHALAASTPMIAHIEILRGIVGDGVKLTATGNLRVVDASRAATQLHPELPAGFRPRSADDVALLQFVVGAARHAGAVRVAAGRMSATKSWTKKGPVEHAVDVTMHVLADGPLRSSTPKGAWTNADADAFIDESTPDLIALIWSYEVFSLDELEEAVVATATASVPSLLRRGPGLASPIVIGTLSRWGRVLVTLGVLEQLTVHPDDGAHPEGADGEAFDGVRISRFGRAILGRYLRNHGYEVPAAGSLAHRPLAELIAQLPEWTPARLSIEFDDWARRRAIGDVVAQLVAAADSTEPHARMAGSQLAMRLEPGARERALREMLAGRARGHATTLLDSLGHDDVAFDGASHLVALVDMLSELATPDDEDEFVEMVSAISDLDALVDEVSRVPEHHAGDVLAAIGRAYPDAKIAKAARKALFRHRSMMANRPA